MASTVTRCAVAMMLLVGPEAVLAHDFWVQPAQWRTELHTPIAVSLFVGHGSDRQRSPIPESRIVRFDIINMAGNRTDVRSNLHLQDRSGDATITFDDPGCYLVALATDDRAESHLPAPKFNEYLLAEGLAPAIEIRQRTGRTNDDGSENYGRTSKAVIQVGADSRCEVATLSRPIGLELEIVLELNPFEAPRPKSLPVRIFYRGWPLAGALVKLTDLARDEKPVELQHTDSEGRAIFAAPQSGGWQLNTVWTRPQEPDRSTDFITHFSSLSFAFSD